MALLETLSAALTTKAAAGMAAATLAGGGLAVAAQNADLPEETEPGQEQLSDLHDDSDDQTGIAQIEFDETLDTEENGEVPEDAESEGRSDDVHGALTEEGELRPGDEGFGEAVADNAQENGREFGESVADAASDGAREQAGEQRAEQSETAGEQRPEQSEDAGEQAETSGDAEVDDNADQRDEGRPDAAEEADVNDNAQQRGQDRR